jgi:hypothetical protein
MRRVSKTLATAALVAVITASNVYAAPKSTNSEPSAATRIVKFIRHVIGLDLGDLSLPHP